ncbi:MAG: hypothetical protein V3U39_00945, partial [Acidimicrobiia bacterium]
CLCTPMKALRGCPVLILVERANYSPGQVAGIGVGKTGRPGLPSLRTVRAVLPHTALRLVVHRVTD